MKFITNKYTFVSFTRKI